MTTRLLSIIGTRPQFIKAAAISRAAKKLKIKHFIVDTGQHYSKNMSFSFVKELEFEQIDYFLKINKKQPISQISEIMKKLELLIPKLNPNFVIVYGDTNSTLAASIVCSKLNKKIAHVEAGLRSENKNMQEEINRILTDNVSSLLFTATKEATQNLLKENFDKKKIYQLGDVMFDSIKYYENKLKVLNNDYSLLTFHRAENVDDKKVLELLVSSFLKLSKKIDIILPIHPRTRKKLIENNLFSLIKTKLKILPPQPYLELLKLIKGSKFIISDSGGIQKEAYFLKKRCFIIRNETEWNELVKLGFNKIISPLKPNFYDNLIKEINLNKKIKHTPKLFGDGKASEKILKTIKKNL